MVGDFLTDLRAVGSGESRLIAFLGSTIGNIHPREVPAFFRSAAAILAPGDGMLVGLDLVKERARLEAAYNDARGVTAEFNRNILRVMNARLGADFDPDAFEHVAFYDAERAWIEMRLRARDAVDVPFPAPATSLSLPAGGEIRTEISCKYTREALEAALSGTGLMLDEWRTDSEDRSSRSRCCGGWGAPSGAGRSRDRPSPSPSGRQPYARTRAPAPRPSSGRRRRRRAIP